MAKIENFLTNNNESTKNQIFLKSQPENELIFFYICNLINKENKIIFYYIELYKKGLFLKMSGENEIIN